MFRYIVAQGAIFLRSYSFLHRVRFFILFLLSFHICSCASLFSGAEPQPVRGYDRDLISKSLSQLYEVPKVYGSSQENLSKVYIFSFDGTENDRDHVDNHVERQTIVGYLSSKLEHYWGDDRVQYIAGPGVGNKADSAFCFSCVDKAQEALTFLVGEVSKEKSANPNVNFKVVILGFSRGAAIGRHFMNLVSETWPLDSEYDVRSYGLLFDTVATSVRDRLSLGIAPTTDYLIHFISRDERRVLFPVVVDNDLAFDATHHENLVTTPRLTQIELPGVHSDIGASYTSGIGTFYRFLGEQALARYGLLPHSKGIFTDDFLSQGAHDSRGILSIFFGVKAYLHEPDSLRKKVIVNSFPISMDRANSLKSMNEIKSGSIYGVTTSGGGLETLQFKVVKNKESLSVVSSQYAGMFKFQAVSFDVVNGERYLTYKYDSSSSQNRLYIDKATWDSIPEGSISEIEVVSVNKESAHILYILVNGKAVKSWNG